MNGRTTELLSKPFNSEDELLATFENLNLHSDDMNAAQIQTALAELMATNQQLIGRIAELENTQQAAIRNNAAITVTQYVDIAPTYTNGDTIQLDAFKVIPEFNGEKKMYRSWRSQVSRLMGHIEAYVTHPKYSAALSIIRAKITGAASDILINNNTAHNIDAIIARLDHSYADQRPLYVIEAEMTNIRQNGKTLQEYFDAINQALNMVLTKVTMTYRETAEQRSLMTETQSKAIRTFVTGLNSSLIRTTLYGSMPKSLAEAFAVAQTIQYDNQHMQLESKSHERQGTMKKQNGDGKPNFNPNFRYQSQQPMQTSGRDTAAGSHNKQQTKPIPMEVDNSKQYVQRTQFRPNDPQAVKREREPSFQHMQRQPSSFQRMKHQRVNHVDEPDDIQTVFACDDSLENNPDDVENADLQSTSQESIFLGE